MRALNRREFIRAAVAGVALQRTRSLPPRPNILFILAGEGLRFTDAYAAAAVCTPTRVGFHTGRYPHRLPIGLQEPLVDGNSQIGIPVEHPTISSLLKANRYETGLIGKWHLGNDPRFNPVRHGFEEFFGIVGGSLGYFTHRNNANLPGLFENERSVEVDGYFGVPDGTITSSNFLNQWGTDGGNRRIVVGVRYVF